jgi:sugar phosphate isomerase/epimerase
MHPRISVHQVCFSGISPLEFADCCRALGARRVSLIAAALAAGELSSLRAVLSAGERRIESLTHVFMPGHLSPEAADWQAPRAELDRLIDVAAQLGARSVYMLTGGHGDLGWEQAAAAFSAAIAPCVVRAREAGVGLMIETALPLYADLHIAHSLRDALTLAEMADLGVCIDLFHCWTEAGLQESIARAMPRCGLIQVSDYVYGDRALPSRAVPGDGALPLARLLKWALDAGYDGAFELELLGPRIDGEGRAEAVARAAAALGTMLRSLGA